MQTSNPAPAYQITNIAWTVPSATEPNARYTVSADSPDSERVCSCKANDYPRSRGRCWHLAAVQAGMAGKPRCRASVIAPAPEPGDEANDYGFTSPEERSDFGFEAPRW